MAAGQITVLNLALPKFAGDYDLSSDNWNVVLCGDAQALDANFSGASGQALYSDLTDEITGDGYAAGGLPLTGVTWGESSGVATFDADAVTWEALTASMKYLVIVRSDGASPPALSDILAVGDLETTDPTGRTSAGGDFTINWTGGIFTLQRAT
jgi:hypothetical protein